MPLNLAADSFNQDFLLATYFKVYYFEDEDLFLKVIRHLKLFKSTREKWSWELFFFDFHLKINLRIVT